MRIRWCVVVTGAMCLSLARLEGQQPVIRDSIGIRIVESRAPTLTGARVLRMDPSPMLVIGTGEGTPHELSRVRGAARLADQSIVVADGGSTELRLFDARGRFVKVLGRKGGGPGEFPALEGLTRLAGDTMVVIAGLGRAAYFDGKGAFLWNLNHRGAGPPASMIVAAFGDGTTVLAGIGNPAPRTRGERWVHAAPFTLVDRSGAVRRALGDLPLSPMVMGEYPSPPWFASPSSTANSATAFFVGLGTEYSIRQYTRDGHLTRFVRRAWTPTPVTRRDIDAYVIEWGKRWIKKTGADADREREDLRDDAYESVVPAFSELRVDDAGRLWVRTPDLRDAPRAGQLNTMPLVPSRWSVFSRDGVWLNDVTLPANFKPLEIGADYLLAVARNTDDVETVVLHRLVGGR